MKILLFSPKITYDLLAFESHRHCTTVFVRCKFFFQGKKKKIRARKEDLHFFFSCIYFVSFHSPDSSVISLVIFSFHLEETAKPGKRCLLMYCYHCCSDSFSHTLCERVISQMEIWGQKAFLMFNEIVQLFEKQCVFHHESLKFFTRIIYFAGFRIQSSAIQSLPIASQYLNGLWWYLFSIQISAPAANLCCLDTSTSMGVQFHVLILVLYSCKSREPDCKILQPAASENFDCWATPA